MLNEVPVAFVLAVGEQSESELKLKIFDTCEKYLADFKRPYEVRIVESLPRATLEKVAKAKLRKILIDEARELA